MSTELQVAVNRIVKEFVTVQDVDEGGWNEDEAAQRNGALLVAIERIIEIDPSIPHPIFGNDVVQAQTEYEFKYYLHDSYSHGELEDWLLEQGLPVKAAAELAMQYPWYEIAVNCTYNTKTKKLAWTAGDVVGGR